MSEIFDRDRLTQKQCAALLGVTPRTLRDWETLARDSHPKAGTGMFPRNADGSYHFRGMVCWFILYRQKHPASYA